MTKEELESHIKSIKHSHRLIDERITELDCDYDEYYYCEHLKKQRLKLKDEISRCETKLQSISTILGKAENLHSDKGYSESTLEKQAEFDKRRNYQYKGN